MIAGFFPANLVCYGSRMLSTPVEPRTVAPHAVSSCRLRPRRGRDRPGAVRVRARRRRSTAPTASCGGSRRSCSRSSTRSTRSACSPRCCSPVVSPTRSGAARCCSSALGTLVGATVLFMLADSVGWLFVARGVQGHRDRARARRRQRRAARPASASRPGRGRPRPTASSAPAGWASACSSRPRSSSSRPHRGSSPTSCCSCCSRSPSSARCLMPEPVARARRPRLTPQRPSVPAAVRRPFLLASLGVISSWSIGGLFLSLGPLLSATCSTPATTSSPASASSRWPAPAPSRNSPSAARRRGRARRWARSRSPPA